jgi:hypothetical protein
MNTYKKTFLLNSGRMEIKFSENSDNSDLLFLISSRPNSRRGFVFISKVLGKHYPVKPSDVVLYQEKLSFLLPDIDNVLVIGMAETAVGLGQGVFEKILARDRDKRIFFSPTTRCILKSPLFSTFYETHSHDPVHYLYKNNFLSDAQLNKIDNLVLVDDEITTGDTLVSLALSIRAKMTNIKKIFFLCLTDWSGLKKKILFESMGIVVLSLFQGDFLFFPNDEFYKLDAKNYQTKKSKCDVNEQIVFSRCGCDSPFTNNFLKPDQLGIPSSANILVLGTGEFLHSPLCLAFYWENLGYKVHFQSTTRTPLTIGDSIFSIRCISDHYNDGVKYYLYNHVLVNPEIIVICYETTSEPVIDNPGCPVINYRINGCL